MFPVLGSTWKIEGVVITVVGLRPHAVKVRDWLQDEAQWLNVVCFTQPTCSVVYSRPRVAWESLLTAERVRLRAVEVVEGVSLASWTSTQEEYTDTFAFFVNTHRPVAPTLAFN
jgi:hypothetical protein